MRSSNSFNKLWIVESLADGELKTGTKLHDDFFPIIRADYPKLNVVLEQPRSKIDFLTCVNKIFLDTTQNKNYPLVHIECHGSEDGLGMSNGEMVEWDEIRQCLVAI